MFTADARFSLPAITFVLLLSSEDMDRLRDSEIAAKDAEIKFLKNRISDLENAPKAVVRGKSIFIFCVFLTICLLKQPSEDFFSYAAVFWIVQAFVEMLLASIGNWIWPRRG